MLNISAFQVFELFLSLPRCYYQFLGQRRISDGAGEQLWTAKGEERGCNLDKWSWLVFSNFDIGTRIFHTIRIYEEFLLNRHLKSVLPAEFWTLVHKYFPSRRVTDVEVDTLCIKVKIGELDKWCWLFLQSAPPLTMGHQPHLPPSPYTTEVTAALHWTQQRGDSCSLQSRCSGGHQ